MGIFSKIKSLFNKKAAPETVVLAPVDSTLPAVRRMNEIIARASEARASRLREVARARR